MATLKGGRFIERTGGNKEMEKRLKHRENFYEQHRGAYLNRLEEAVSAFREGSELDGEVLKDVEREVQNEVAELYPDLAIRRGEGLNFIVHEKGVYDE